VQVPLTFFVVFAIGPVLLLAHILPISIGGWGVREAAAVALLGMTGVDATSALLVSIMFGVRLVLATLPGRVVLADVEGMSPSRLHRCFDLRHKTSQRGLAAVARSPTVAASLVDAI
jgi:hypothetical protein